MTAENFSKLNLGVENAQLLAVAKWLIKPFFDRAPFLFKFWQNNIGFEWLVVLV